MQRNSIINFSDKQSNKIIQPSSKFNVNKNNSNPNIVTENSIHSKHDNIININQTKITNKIYISANKLSFKCSEQTNKLLNIQNISKNLVKINICLPQTKYFKLKEEERYFALPSGMSRKINISISNPPSDSQIIDYFFINSGQQTKKIQLNWEPQSSSIIYNTLFDLGAIQINKNKKVQISFLNKSKIKSKIKIIKDTWDSIQIDSEQIILESLETRKVIVSIYPQQQAAFHHKFLIQINGKPDQPFQIIYAAVMFVFRLQTQQGNQLKQLSFGTLLRGTRKQMVIWANNRTSQQMQVRTKVKKGKNINIIATLQTPNELGQECSSTVMQCITKSVKILPFSRQQLVITTESLIEQRQKLLVQRYGRTQKDNNLFSQKIREQKQFHREILSCQLYNSSKINSLSSSKSCISLPLSVGFSLPMIKIIPSALILGQYYQGQNIVSQFTITNNHQFIINTFTISKILNTEFIFNNNKLLPKEHVKIGVQMKARNLGKFLVQMTLMIENIYKIKIPVEYSVKSKTISVMSQNRQKTNDSFHSNKQVDFLKTSQMTNNLQNKKKYQVCSFRLKKNKFSQSVSSFHKQKIQKQNSNSLHKPYKQQCQLIQKGVQLDKKAYPLFVTKKINKYEPYEQGSFLKKVYKSQNKKDYFGGQIRRNPKNRKQIQQISRQLTPQQLQLVIVNDRQLDFGKFFINSYVQKEWSIINGTDNTIAVQLIQPKQTHKMNFLDKTDFEQQLVPCNGTRKFKIILYGYELTSFQTQIKYVINKIHTFKMQINGQIQPVTLSISKYSLKMMYVDDNDLLLKDNFQIKNQGNSIACFNFEGISKRLYLTPLSGKIKPGQIINVKISQTLQMFQVVQAGQGSIKTKNQTNIQFDQKINMNIQNGINSIIKVGVQTGILQPRCMIRENKLIFGCTIVNKSKTKTFQLKNLSRNICVFQIDALKWYDFLSFDCTKGRIPPQGNKQITVTYKSSIIHTLDSSFNINIRGGLIINVPFSVQSIAPQLSIIQNDFNLGQINCDNSTLKQVTIRNDSQIPVDVVFDNLTKQRGMQFLLISLVGSQTLPISHIATKQNKTNIGSGFYRQTNNIVGSSRGSQWQQQVIDGAITQLGPQRLKIQPKSTFSFHIVFKPTYAGYYQFTLPIYLQNYLRNQSLTRYIICSVIQPRISMQPSLLRFKRRIITDKEGQDPQYLQVTLKNTTDRELKWKIQKLPKQGHHSHQNSSKKLGLQRLGSRQINNASLSGIYFDLSQKKGNIKPKQSINILICFNPLEEGVYHHKMPLMIYDDDKQDYDIETQIKMEGQGQSPSLSFNSRQIILPPVPLNIESLAVFTIYNRGYQVIKLKHRFQFAQKQSSLKSQSQKNQQLSLIFPEGQRLGLGKQSIVVLVRFLSRRSVSFTANLYLFDDTTDCRYYTLPISATAQNSVMTTFNFLKNPRNLFKLQWSLPQKKIKMSEQQAVQLKYLDLRNILDRYHNPYDQISLDYYNNDCKILKRWINYLFRQEKIRQFPKDLITAPQLFIRILQKLTGKKQLEPGNQIQINGERHTLHSQPGLKLNLYQTIFEMLLNNYGMLLHHLRPQFLLQKQECMNELSKSKLQQNCKAYYSKYLPIIYIQNWVSLFYQLIIKFWCKNNLVNNKLISNVYSTTQMTVIKWIHTCCLNLIPHEDPTNIFLSFGKDFKNYVAPNLCLINYCLTDKQKCLAKLHYRPTTQSQIDQNSRLMYELLQRFNISPLIYQEQYQKCGDKEIFLFMHQLYQVLPQFQPKTTVLQFACQLGKTSTRTIQLKNPSFKSVQYWIKFEGCRDFSALQKDFIQIQAKGTSYVTIQYKARLSKSQICFISFQTKQQGEANSANASAMVFQLRGKITQRSSLKLIDNVKCPLYESLSFKVNVQNPFQDQDFGNFTVRIMQQSCISNSVATQTSQSQQKQHTKFCQFYCESDFLKIKKGGTCVLQMCFSPYRLSVTKCFIIFLDQNLGQFQYQLKGIVDIPKVLQQIKVSNSIVVGQQDSFELNLPVYNNYKIRTQNLLQLRCANYQKTTKQQGKFYLQLNMDPAIKDHITFPTQITNKNKAYGDLSNKLKFNCLFKKHFKDLVLDFILIGYSRKEVQDVRRFRVTLIVLPRPLQKQIIITTTARSPIVKSFLFQNCSTKDWKIKLNMLQNQNGWFKIIDETKSIMRQGLIRKGQSSSIDILFSPQWIQSAFSKISMQNLTTNETIILNIKGLVEQSLSEGHLNLKADNYNSVFQSIVIKNPYKEKGKLSIQTDISVLQPPQDLIIQQGEIMNINIPVKPTNGITFTGFMKFMLSQQKYFWYTVTVQSREKPTRQFWVQLSSEVGSEQQKQVQFKNPFNSQLYFTTQINSKCIGLECKNQFMINANSSYSYKIKFKPIHEMDDEATIKIYNKEIGKFIYRLRLIAHQSKKRKVYQMQAQVGKLSQLSLTLQNKNKQPVKVFFYLSDPKQFSIEGNDIFQPKNNHIKVNFNPKNVGQFNCKLRVWGSDFPTKYYEIQAQGVAPFTLQKLQFTSNVGDSKLQIIKFSSHQKYCEATVSLSDDFNFKLIKNQKWITDQNGILAVPVQFKPSSKGCFQSQLLVRIMDYQWRYILLGTTSLGIKQQILQQITVKNKQQTTKLLKVSIPSYLQSNASIFKDVSIDHMNQNVLKMFKKWMKLKVYQTDDIKEKMLCISLKINPQKVVTQIIKLVISGKKQGQTFSVNVKINVIENGKDQVLVLQLSNIKNISYQLKGMGNIATVNAKMLKGTNCSVQRKGENIVLFFRPTHLLFSKTKTYTDNLILISEDNQWNYQIQFKLNKP